MNEKARLEALRKFEILDTPPDGTFDHIVKVTAQLLNVPIAIVSLVDEDRIWFKSKVGLDVVQINRDSGLCASAIFSNDDYIIENATVDPRCLANPLVAGEFGLQFYAAAPLTTKDGFNLGTLCIIDKKPRKLSAQDYEILKQLAVVVMDQMELRLQARQAVFSQNQLAQLVTHNLKGFISSIPALISIMRKEKADSQRFESMLEMLEFESIKSYKQINNFLEQSARFAPEVTYDFKLCDLNELISKAVGTNDAPATKKSQTIKLQKESKPLLVNADANKIIEAIDNLINNAIKFSSANTQILIELVKENDKALLQITDQGQGLTIADKALLFKRYAKLSAVPTGDELSSGMGLWMTKEIIDAHNGKIEATSAGKNLGTTFCIELNLQSN